MTEYDKSNKPESAARHDFLELANAAFGGKPDPAGQPAEARLPEFEARRDAPEAAPLSPRIEWTVSLKKDVLAQLSPADMQALRELVTGDEAKDPRFEQIFAANAGVRQDMLKADDLNVPPEIAAGFSPRGLVALRTLAAAYASYQAPFPNKDETEPFGNLLEYMTSREHNWDMRVAYNADGIIIGGTAGRQLPVALPDGGEVRAAWIEHTWAHEDVRGKGLGTALYQNFERSCETNPQLIFIEIDNPHALSQDPRMHDLNDPAAREKAWREEEGQAMDPYKRISFWAAQGFQLIAAKGAQGVAAAPYVQISMDPREQDACETMFAGVKVNDRALLSGDNRISAQLYEALYPAIQGTIDPDLHLYPEFARTMRRVSEAASLELIDPKSAEGHRALRNGAAGRDELADAAADVRYCEELLRRGELRPEQAAVVRCNLERSQSKLA